MSLQNQRFFTPTDSTPSDSLLGTLQHHPELQHQFQSSPGILQTIALPTQDSSSSLDRGQQSPPAAKPLLSQTVEQCLSSDSPVSRDADCGFIPLRQIAKVGSRHRDDADYRFVGQLGAGGTGVVFQAHQRAVDREVAVKMLRSEHAVKPHLREQFLAEARVIGGLDHPNVIALHEVYSDKNGSLFYSMKRIDGTSWDKQIDDLSLSQNIEILLRVADAIRYAHSRGLIHRDIKPENVMLGKFGEVLVADWGLAVKYQTNQTVAATNSIGGTPAYMAPELASASAGAISFQTDVYLLGAILYRVLTGKPPHNGPSLLQCIQAAANNVIEPTDTECELMTVAMRAMATSSAERFASVDQFIDAIKDERQHEQSQRLIRRAIGQAEHAINSTDSADAYRDFGIADALLCEAIALWPSSLKAREVRKRLQLQFAAIATERGDYDLAAAIYEAVGEAKSDEAQMVEFHRLQREASQRNASRYLVLFTQSPDPGVLIDLKTLRVVEANIAFAKMFGYECDKIVDMALNDLGLWVNPEQQQILFDQAIRRGSVDDFAAQLNHADGHSLEVLINSRVIEIAREPMLLSTIRNSVITQMACPPFRRQPNKTSCNGPLVFGDDGFRES
ncbi:protein kinase domain-containing protein [Stieleria varia]|uniref:Serine/threonine-protein kinase PknD n=1 Tax=Stieleria varia TaxID=2528005 RepID=A0A5C6B829_9BACT|nr:protein kinase [Stieleria varia]TWU08425.1 Serine/threonine-protein kinase PknD [Stieleria varia]